MPKLRFFLLLGLLAMLMLPDQSFGQTTYSGANWYFGNSVYGMRFNRPDQTVSLDSTHMSPPFGRFGNATANEPETGNLLFYTDGQIVYDANFQVMDGINVVNPALQLNADVNKNQNTAIVGEPGSMDRYLIFTNTPAGSINYSVIDMSQPGNAVFPQPALGSAVLLNQTIANSTANASHAMLVIAKSDLSGYWLITLDQGSNDYKVLDINGNNPAAWTEQTYTLGTVLFDAANMSYSDVSNKIAVSPRSQNTNIQILDFDPTTGVLTFDVEILNSGNADLPSEAIYDTEWSTDGTKLYISRYGGAANVGDLLQWDSTLPASSSLISVLPAQIFGSYGLQIGPDGNIYHLYEEFNGAPLVVGSISDIDSVAALVQYTPQVFSDQDFSSYQFPSLLPPRQVLMTMDFTYAGTCSNSPTTFYPTITPAPDFVAWDFGDGGNSTLLSPVYTYTAGGTYTVSLMARLNGQTQVIQKPITITQFDLQVNVTADTVACQCELPKYGPTCTQFSVTATASGGSGAESYIWSNGDTGPTLTPDSAGYYYVIVTDPAIPGCSAYAGVNVQEYGATDQRANVWYFGQNAGIDFNPPGATPLDDGIMDTPEGCTAISDRNGIVLFYTNGDDIYVKDKVTGVHSLLDTGLGGNAGSAQSVIAVPFPNDETLYYIFTTEEVGGTGGGNYEFKFSVFDLKLNNGAGGIAQKNIPLFSKSTERITANNNWVIIHEYGNNNFRAYPITTTGLGNAVVSSMGADHSTADPAFGQGYMKFSGDGTKLAVALSDGAGQSYVDVFEWTDSLGQVTDYKQLDLTADGAVGQVYGVEFSPSGVKLYATVQGAGSSTIMEYRADTLSLMHVINPAMSASGTLGAIQVGPDGQVYVAADGSNFLGVINVNPDTALVSTYNPNGFALSAGTTSTLGLPNFAQNFGSGQAAPAFFVSSPVCLGQQITMSAVVTSVIDTAFWQIADNLGNIVFTSQNLTDSTTLNTAGDYLVSLLIGNRCGFNVAFSQTITVNPPPANSTLPAGLPLCGTSTVLNVYDTSPPNIADLNFLWSTGETTDAITVSNQGTYDVTITDITSGCTTTASVFVGPPFVTDLGPDLTICENDPLTMDSQANASNYTWFIDNNPVVPANNQRTFDFGAQGLPGGTYTVRVEVEDPVDPTCIVVDEAIITVNPQPVIGAPTITNATCGNADGAIDFIITNAGTGSYTFDLSGPVNLVSQPVVAGAGNAPNLPAGIYIITVYNTVSGCSNSLNGVLVENAPPAFNVTSAVELSPDGCDPANPSGSIDITIDNPAAFPIDYILRDETTNTIVSQANGVPDAGSQNFIISNLPAGTYAVELDPTGCTVFANGIVVNPTPVTDLVVVPTIAECGTSLDFTPYLTSGSPTPTFEWSLTSGGPYNSIGTAYTDLGNQTVYFKASSPALCDSIRAVDVTLVPTPTVTITRDDSEICNGRVTLTAVADGGFPAAQLSYRWSTGETSQSIVVTQSGIVNINVSNLQNLNCFGTASENITMPTPFTVSLTSTLACDDGKPFTLTATATNSNVDYAWKLNGVDLPDITSQIQSINAGVFEVIVTDRGPGACSNSATLEVIKAPVTPTELSSSVVFCPDEGDVTLDAGPGFISYLWSTGETTRQINVNQGGVYALDATNNFNCVTTDQTELLEDCIPTVTGPTAFRPGGLNSEYYLFTKYVDDFEIFIYNRWGELVFQSNDKDFRWDGTLDGQLLPADQYTWVVRYTSSFRDRGTLEQYGGVVLLR